MVGETVKGAWWGDCPDLVGTVTAVDHYGKYIQVRNQHHETQWVPFAEVETVEPEDVGYFTGGRKVA